MMIGWLIAGGLLLFTTAHAQSKYDGEKHLNNFRQLTFGGENAEAYWSFDGTKLVCQRTLKKEGVDCDRIYTATLFEPMNKIRTEWRFVQPEFKQLSNGNGRTTCAYFLPGDSLIVYASTHGAHAVCPAEPPREKGRYLWPLYPDYELYIADLNGNIRQQLTSNNFYDAEAVVSPNGNKILFTSNRTGDLELFTMNLDGSEVKQITHEEGYDGGAFFSPDGRQIVWRASVFADDKERQDYRDNLKKNLVSPMRMELFVADADGGNRRQVTRLGGANWAPFFHPSGRKILFSSNHKTQTIPFNLFMIDVDGTNLEQVTFDPVFDSFPMFSPDGKKLLFCSNRNNNGTRDTNIFMADWKD